MATIELLPPHTGCPSEALAVFIGICKPETQACQSLYGSAKPGDNLVSAYIDLQTLETTMPGLIWVCSVFMDLQTLETSFYSKLSFVLHS